MKNRMTRRSALGSLSAGGAAAAAMSLAQNVDAADEPADDAADAPLKGNINHSVCSWCYRGISLEDLCKAAKEIGLKSIELQGPKQWPLLKKYGLTCAIAGGPGGISSGFNRIENHDKLVKGFEELIPMAADAGVPSIICFSGNRKGLDDEQGIVNCTKGLKRIMKLAEEKKVNVVMELLNSKVNHKDYQCDHTAWGAEIYAQVGSERFGLLYDIYHMQIMEGDIIRTIKDNAECIAHYHTGGVPGRNEIDETQEIYYPAVMRAIVETGYKGYVGQEFIPANPDKIESLRKAVRICDV